MTDTVIGYPEFPYWKEQYCNPNNDQGFKKMNAENWEDFKDVEMIRDNPPYFEHLFNRVSPFD